ncbi:MAG: wax ester/triacylglycerol synthase family O-acyltransferase [Gordonia sp. (in: high G+C Gram-positive bacteria)]|nr:wax ester/triacylglycerol synthase family O-acyltransferase [Gordonia sp. (in: high G+C Gram-positive bacteria)]
MSTAVTGWVFPETDVDSDSVVDWIARRAAAVRPLRLRVVHAAGRIGDAYWSETKDFDARAHVHVHHCMDWTDVKRLAVELHGQPFDDRRPLWAVHVVRSVTGPDDLPGRHMVVLVKRHHAIADGALITSITESLFRDDVPSTVVTRPTSRFAVTARELAVLPFRPFLIAADVARLFRLHRRIAAAERASDVPEVGPLPRTEINGRPSGLLDTDTVFCSIAALRREADRIGVSVNDVVLTVLGRALATYLDLDAGSLAAQVPISTDRGAADGVRNHVSLCTVDLGVGAPRDDASRAIRLAVRAQAKRLRASPHVDLPASLPRLPGFVFAALFARRLNTVEHDGPTPAHTSISSPPPSASTGLSLCGSAPITRFSVGSLEVTATNHIISRLDDQMSITVSCDPRQMVLPAYIATIRRELSALASTAAPLSQR